MADGNVSDSWAATFHKAMTTAGIGVMLVMLYFIAMGFREKLHQEDMAKLVNVLMADPAFVQRAGLAGYRVEGSVSKHYMEGTKAVVVARCVRANERGPVPCDPFPYDPRYPNAPVQVMR